MRYPFYLLDADDTLYDFPLAQLRAVTFALERAGYPAGEGEIARFHSINARLWKLRETCAITQEELILRRFTELFAGEARYDDRAASEAYLQALSHEGPLLPGAIETLRALRAAGAKTAIVTNGVARTQRGRFAASGVDRLVDALIISEEIGCFKPDPGMPLAALRALGCEDPSLAVMAGDTFSTDILAAQRAGVAACWVNPAGDPVPEGCAPPEHQIRSIAQILSL